MKRLLSFVLAAAFLLSSLALTLSADEPENAAGGSAGQIYSIPEDAEQVLLQDEVYTVIRTYAEFAAAFPQDIPGVTDGKYILAADIDCGGTAFTGKAFTFARGTVLEGNGFGLVNLTAADGLFDFVTGDLITFRNFHIGTAEQPVVLNNPEKGGNTAVVSSFTNSETRWENCHVYADVSVKDGYAAVWLGHARGTHTFVDCTVHGNVETTNGGNVALLVGGDGEFGMLNLNLEGCSFYGSVSSSNNSASVIGWCPSNVTMVDCANYASVTGVNAGGFVGNSASCAMKLSFEGCINYGSISGSSGSALVGGFVGQDRHENATYTDCINFGDVSTAKNGAGFVANLASTSTFTNCLNVGNISKMSSGEHLGGIVGWGVPVIVDCANIGTIDGANTAGNLVGKGAPASIQNSWGFGKTQGAAANGCLIGANDGEGSFSSNRYLENVSGSVSIGADASGKVTLSEALALVQEKYPQYHFIVSDGSIVPADSHLRAVQSSQSADREMSLRVLGTVNTLSLKTVGFVGRVLYPDENGDRASKEVTLEQSGTSRVHKSILSNGGIVTSGELLGDYIFTLKLVGLPAQGEVLLELAPVSVIAGEENQQIVGETLTIRYADGRFVSALPGTVEETEQALIPLEAYTGGGGDTGEDVDPDAGHAHPYTIPADAAEFTIGEQTYTVIRSYEELKAALSGQEGEDGTRVPQQVHLILADTLNGGGETLDAGSLLVGAGSVLEGNGYTLFGYTGVNVFAFENGEEILFRNFYLGCEEKPIVGFASGGGDVGLIAGFNESITRWENCHVYADLTVTGGGNVAAWIAAPKGTHTFIGCSTYGRILSSNNSAPWGGYVMDGETSMTFENCTNYAEVQGSAYAGGFIAHVNQQVGAEKLTFLNCTNYGELSGGTVGGIMGHNRKNATFTNCVNDSNLTGSSHVGGIVALTSTNSSASMTLTGCRNYGSIQSSSGNAAGIVANNQITQCTMTDCVNVGDVVSSSQHVGGFVGWNAGGLTVARGLNAGDISGAHSAGIVGRSDTGKPVQLVDCANIGTIRQTVAEGSASNIGGYMTGSSGTITGCFAFGRLHSTKYPGILVCSQSAVSTSEGNRYFEFGNTEDASAIGLDESSLVSELEEALRLLEERFESLHFKIADGSIVLDMAEA